MSQTVNDLMHLLKSEGYLTASQVPLICSKAFLLNTCGEVGVVLRNESESHSCKQIKLQKTNIFLSILSQY